MQLKKLLQGSAFALVAAACAIAVPSVVKAATSEQDPVEPEKGSIEAAGLTDVTFDGSELYIEGIATETDRNGAVTTQGTTEIQVGFGKVKNNAVTVSSWDTYDGETATVDLSKLSCTKDNYVVITTPGKDKMVVKIPAGAKKIKAKFNAAEGTLEAGSGDTATAAKLEASTVAEDGTKTAKSAGNYEFRTAYSGWMPVEKAVTETDKGTEKVTGYELEDLTLYQQEGAKLFVRVKATPTKLAEKDGEQVWAQSTSEKLKYGNVEAGVYVAGTLPSKEVKVTVPAKAKGPKATADYAKGTVKFAKDCEYRLATSEKIYKHKDNKDDTPAASLKEATSAPTTPTTIKKLYEDVGVKFTDENNKEVDLTNLEEATIEVRKAAKGNKAASKWGVLEVELPKGLTEAYYKYDGDTKKLYAMKPNKSDELVETEITAEEAKAYNIVRGVKDPEPSAKDLEEVDEDKEKPYGGKGVAESTMKESDSKTDVLKVKYTKSSNKADAKPALEVTNSGNNTYEIVVKKETDAARITDSDKPVKVTSKKPVVIKNVEDGANVFVRIAGDKKTTTWVGKYSDFGEIDLEKAKKGTKKAESK